MAQPVARGILQETTGIKRTLVLSELPQLRGDKCQIKIIRYRRIPGPRLDVMRQKTDHRMLVGLLRVKFSPSHLG